MNKTIFILSTLVFIASSCGQKSNKQANTKNNEIICQTIIDEQETTEINETIIYNFKTFEFEFGFKVTVRETEVFEVLKTYENFKLERNNNVVYFDNSWNEYEFDNTLFPIMLQTGDNSFELLFEMNNRPSQNYLKRLFVNDDIVVGQDKLPIFEAKPIDINNDGIKEYAGSFGFFEIWGENYNLTTYNPILYYSVTETGLKLDSLLTKQRNEIIYGQFYGFSYSEKFEIPKSVIEKFEQELKIIRNEID